MKFALFLAVLLVSSCVAESGITDTPVSGFDTAAMDRLLGSAVENGDVIGVSALVFDDGETVYTGAYGLRDRERQKPVDLDTVYRIYSMTKPITSAIIMDLQEDGLLDINDSVSKYIPELANMQVMSTGENGQPIFAPQATQMTVKDLLLHRAGLAYGIFGSTNPVEAMYEKAGLFEPTENLSVKMTKLSKLPLIIQPGDGWYYSYSIDVLGRIAEVVTGQTLGEIMDERIFDPLGMNDTGFQVRPDKRQHFSSNYFLQEDGTFGLEDDGQVSHYLNDNAFESGGGGLVGTLGDYAKFAQMMLDGGIYNGHRVLDEAIVKTMMSDQMDPDDKFMFPWLGRDMNISFGYGGNVITSDTPDQLAKYGRAQGQWGWSGAARTNFWIDPENESFGIIMLQFFSQNDPALHDQFRVMVHDQTKDAD